MRNVITKKHRKNEVLFSGTEYECTEILAAINLLKTKLKEQDICGRTICYCDEYGNFLNWLDEPVID